MAFRPRSRWFAGALVLLAVLLLIAAADRVLLAYYGLPLWEADPVLHFRHRANVRSAWPEWLGGKPLHTNRLGFFDDDFPAQKPAGEFRALAIGDSVLMGHGVSSAEALPNQLEALLLAHDGGDPAGPRSYQVINAGVQGYWTDQYLAVLQRDLRLGPDLIIIGFCMNDVIGSHIFDPADGGTGLDYHGIRHVASPWLSYLVNETGFGRLAIRLQLPGANVEAMRRRARYGARRVALQSYDDPEVRDGWRRALDNLAAAYEVAGTNHVPIVLLILPYRFQLGEPQLQEPQRILARHAAIFDVPYFDATPVLEAAVTDGAGQRELFIDHDHLQARGHALVAAALYTFLQARHLIPSAALTQR